MTDETRRRLEERIATILDSGRDRALTDIKAALPAAPPPELVEAEQRADFADARAMAHARSADAVVDGHAALVALVREWRDAQVAENAESTVSTRARLDAAGDALRAYPLAEDTDGGGA